MFSHILIPVDLHEERNNTAVAIGRQMAAQNNSRLSLIHVIELISDSNFDEFEEFYLRLEEQSLTQMSNLLGDIADDDTVSQVVVYGDRVQEIVAYAAENEVDLIILNSHRINLEDPTAGWGTISYKVGILAQCPVMLVK
jgi:nucleotide-binding universal stress UspA family protein